MPQAPLLVRVNAPLMEWVLENLCKNAVDAMNGSGKITVSVSQDGDNAYVDVSDTGKGISKSCHKRVFEPGYTTKKRGWGLGLSLTKRIVQQYHKGRIFVKSSEIGKGTTFRIEMRK
jgi:signal transduction histidine kinase